MLVRTWDCALAEGTAPARAAVTLGGRLACLCGTALFLPLPDEVKDLTGHPALALELALFGAGGGT